MANAWRLSERVVAFNLDECEEIILLAAYAAVRDRVGYEPWLSEFEEMFLGQPRGPSARVIGAINNELRRSGRMTLLVRLTPTAKSDWMRWRSPEKAERRRAMLEQVSSKAQGGAILAAARAAAAQLPAPKEWEQREQEALFAEAESWIAGAVPPMRSPESNHRPLAANEILTRVAALAAQSEAQQLSAVALKGAQATDRGCSPASVAADPEEGAPASKSAAEVGGRWGRLGIGGALALLGRLEETQRAMAETQREQLRIQRAQLALLQEIADAIRADAPPYPEQPQATEPVKGPLRAGLS